MANEYIRKEWTGAVIRTTLSAPINAAALAIPLTDGSSFPSGVRPFVLVIDRGTATEEKIIVTSRTGNNLTVLQRGYDGSSAQSHSSGAYIEHILDAYTVDQTNAIATAMTTQGDILYKTVTGENTSFGRVGIGTTGYPLVAAGTAPAYQQLGNTGIASNAVTAAKVNSDVAGLGLVKNGTSLALDVNVDNSTVEINADTVRVKDGGITSAKILDGTIVNGDINAAAAIAYSKLALTGSIVAGDFAAAAKPVVICTSSTRPSTPVEGQVIYETDTDRELIYHGAAWVVIYAKGTYTPSAGGTMVVGTGGSAYNSADWTYVYGTLNISGRWTFGTTGTTLPNAPITLTYPSGFTAETTTQSSNVPLGNALYNISGSNYMGNTFANLSSNFRFLVNRYNPTLAATPQYVDTTSATTGVPATWVTGSTIAYTLQVQGTLAP